MELIKELLREFIKGEHFEINFSNKTDLEKIMENKCYIALREIREIIRNDELEDSDCFEKIEEIVSLFESMGIDCGSRHDFG